MSDEPKAGQRGPNYNWEIESRHWEQECYNLRDMMVTLDNSNERLAYERDQLKKALEFARMTLKHAINLDYLGEGSTRDMAEEAIKKANKVLGDE